ncbi:MAG: hypothetical protein QM808_00800 [Steroidobacteraceae bacterium]
MKSQASKVVVIATLSLLSSTAFSAVSSLVKKEAGAKEITYTYQYTCSNGKRGEFSVSAATDAEATKLADQKAKKVCEE